MIYDNLEQHSIRDRKIKKKKKSIYNACQKKKKKQKKNSALQQTRKHVTFGHVTCTLNLPDVFPLPNDQQTWQQFVYTTVFVLGIFDRQGNISRTGVQYLHNPADRVHIMVHLSTVESLFLNNSD